MKTVEICIIGGGPAGLAAADAASNLGAQVLLTDQMPTFGRKLLMAGKSGLNLTKDEASTTFRAQISTGPALDKALSTFGPVQAKAWAQDLGQPIFTGSSGRVFPRCMKASPLVRAWIQKLTNAGVLLRTRWRWLGWEGGVLRFATPDGIQTVQAKATVLALGGASWARLGSDGQWTRFLSKTVPFQASNVGVNIAWSPEIKRYVGMPVKGVRVSASALSVAGEFVISESGAEGGAIYGVCTALRKGGFLEIDLLPDISELEIFQRLQKPQGKVSLANHLRKTLRLSGVKAALLREGGSLPKDFSALATRIKKAQIAVVGCRSIDEAISTAGGVGLDQLNEDLMLREHPGTFCAGEMIDWDAPTGGYLITTCLATGFHAGRGAAAFARHV